MEKRWHKISDLVEAQILVKIEAEEIAFMGRIQIYTPEGWQLTPIVIDIDEKYGQEFFLYNRYLYTYKNEIMLYYGYEDIKNMLIRDKDINGYDLDEVDFNIEMDSISDQAIIDNAKNKLIEFNSNLLKSQYTSFYPSGEPFILSGIKAIKTKFAVSNNTIHRWIKKGAPIIVHNSQDRTGAYSQKTGGAIRYTCDYHRLYHWLLANPNS